jgi:hypothetical protein
VLAEAAEQRSGLQQQWQQLHQQRMAAAARQVDLWQHRTIRWMGQAVDGPQQQQQQQAQQQGCSEAGVCGAPQQQVLIQGYASDAISSVLTAQQDSEPRQPQQQRQQQEEMMQQQQQQTDLQDHQQQHQQEDLQGSSCTSAAVSSSTQQQQESRSVQQPGTADPTSQALSPLQHQQQQQEQMLQLQQQPEQHPQQHQQQQRPAAWPDPIGWFLLRRLRSAQAWLAEQQQAEALSDRGAQLWHNLCRHATGQVCPYVQGRNKVGVD